MARQGPGVEYGRITMPDKLGFVDLRIGHGAQGIGDDSVWPSFTDIMTVILSART